MYKALYREYRPEVFSDMLGQEHIVRILRNQIETDSTSHAYLFCGTRGTGKTTTARLLAKGLNCLSDGQKPCGTCDVCMSIKNGNYLDVIEIDAASNNGVDNIRDLRESVKYPPAVGKKKVYIIDEVHMLSTGAYNALLKTLEEPPEYVTFILATTEPNKLPATILSRCMRLDFKRVPEKILIRGMGEICSKKGIQVTEDALKIIAANADGSVRDGLSILDQCIAGGDMNVTTEDVLDFLGASGEDVFIKLTDYVRRGQTGQALSFLAEELEDGKDVKLFIKDWINHFRNLLMVKYINTPQEIINMSVENIDRIRHQSDALELRDLNGALLELSKLHNEAKFSSQPRILLELAIVRLSTGDITPPKGQAHVSLAKAAPKASTKAEALGTSSDSDREELMEKAGHGQGSLSAGDDNGNPLFNYDAVWKAVFDDVEGAKGSFYMLASDGKITSMDENQFKLVVDKDYQVELSEKNRDLIERLVATHTDNRKRHMVVFSLGNDISKEAVAAVDDTARRAEELFGIKVDIN